jgi:hypothetical protein
MPASVLNSQLATKALKSGLGYGFVDEQRKIKGVIPLHEGMAIAVNVEMVANLWFSMSPCEHHQFMNELLCREDMKHARPRPNCARWYLSGRCNAAGREKCPNVRGDVHTLEA